MLRNLLKLKLAAASILLMTLVINTTGSSHISPSDVDSDSSPLQVVQLEVEKKNNADPDSNLTYLFAVFFITWAGFFGYVFVMSRRQKEMRQEIDALKMALVEKTTDSNTIQ